MKDIDRVDEEFDADIYVDSGINCLITLLLYPFMKRKT